MNSINGIFTIFNENVSIVVDSNHGARITSLKVKGYEFLIQQGIGARKICFGSTFWTSPQSDWGWPPRKILDSEPYDAKIVNDKGVLESAADIDSNDPLTTYIQLKKEISIDKNSWLSLRYTMTNKSNTNIIRAPWQINRCPQAGFVFFEMGPGGQTHFTECQWVKNLNLKSSPGKPVWIDVANCPDRYKTICDGTGWLAHVYGKQLFIMRFDDIPAGQAAQGEGEIEIYVCNPQEEGQLGYVELEAQGTPIQLKPGEKTSWTVQWKAIILENEIPKNIDEEQKSKLYQYYYDIATMKK